MARRKRSDALGTREQILDAAEWCFCSYGISHTNMETIAARANCTRGAIYWHFGSPTDIIKGVMERGQLPLNQQLQTLSDAPAPLIPKLRDCLCQCFAEIRCNRHVHSALTILLLRNDFVGVREPFLDARYQDAIQILEPLEAVLERARANGEICDDLDVRICAELVQDTLIGAMRQSLLRSKDDQDSPAAHAIGVLMALLAGWRPVAASELL
ncbi:TetR family transcriptional regulator [Xanthomonas citri pv. durantae]|uniref:TetR family transcriptional regulator n=1 Tax=Xanthomonas citri pv. durantae TaxID=487862 RepID=A0A9X6BGU9_XANCI|nr:TetR family transcriptional regulator [Xanthomonas citri]QRD56547.1 TetR family transcriptional regulator [Xanthomonas citri pv. citri]UVG57023.1 TetR family transcriptional regulator [Xanthomonas citri pv. durantae]CEH47458.1 putative HTH-type transcriptional regulator, AcrR-family [Xanthomonas citri pv. citri]CEH93961.1 putative HTH-type transcriptional regulator, AcrR-family [Xanthomonas citri pv. citri]